MARIVDACLFCPIIMQNKGSQKDRNKQHNGETRVVPFKMIGVCVNRLVGLKFRTASSLLML